MTTFLRPHNNTNYDVTQLRQGHEKEKKELIEMRSMLKASFNDRDDKDHKEAKEKMKDATVYNLHQMQVR